MFRKLVSRSLPAFALAALLAMPAPAHAAGFLGGQAPDLVKGLWGWLVTLLPNAPQTDLGCNIDPNGQPRCSS
jgi:hypothetical protein